MQRPFLQTYSTQMGSDIFLPCMPFKGNSLIQMSLILHVQAQYGTEKCMIGCRGQAVWVGQGIRLTPLTVYDTSTSILLKSEVLTLVKMLPRTSAQHNTPREMFENLFFILGRLFHLYTAHKETEIMRGLLRNNIFQNKESLEIS